MQFCPVCGQSVAEGIATCPACGGRIAEGRRAIDDYRIVDVLHEGYSTFLCRAIRERTDEHVMIRLFTPRSGVNAEVAARLQRELEELKKLPAAGFVRHHAIRRSQEGLWYRISEWIETESWGSLLAAGRLTDRRLLIDLFNQMAEILTVLHRHGHFIPHLILNDIMVVRGADGQFKIKIDYKLSRFIDPKLDRPAPMLKQLLGCHPDIVNRRPLDFRSDIWSLAKVFVELLSGDFEIDNLEGRIDELDVPDELAVLLRVMLADDPDLRPQSMEQVVSALARIKAQPPAAAAPVRLVQRLQKRVRVLAAVVAVLALAGLAAWFYLDRPRRDAEGALEGYANQYARSVAFVLVDYWIESGSTTLFRNVAEGTAFLVDQGGYLLTSRHVVCPWLEDPQFAGAMQYVRMHGVTAKFGYRLYLWFEGAKAFSRAGRMIEGAELTDVYFTENAYSSDSSPRVDISGVANPPVRTRQLITSPLRDDFAVIKVERVPEGLIPLPLDLDLDPRRLPKLTRVIALGFPLGSRTQQDAVNASVVRGNVRRAFENVFQIDASLHGGNSGGPVIDTRGKVIGIVSAVAMDYSQGLVPIAMPVWDIGLALPITEAVKLLVDLKAGDAKWNGVIDFSMEAALGNIREIAMQGRWAEAMAAADDSLGRSPQPSMTVAAGMMHFCNSDFRGARQRFSQALSMNAEDNQARLMLVLIDWLTGSQAGKAYHQDLAGADWKSAAEFQGYLLQLLEGRVGVEVAVNGWYSPSEKSWLNYIAGLVRLRQANPEAAEPLLEQAVLAADPDGWEIFLARAKLDEVRKLRRNAAPANGQAAADSARIARFDAAERVSLETKKKRQEELSTIGARLAGGELSLEEKRAALQDILRLEPDNRAALGTLAFAAAAAEDFPEALAHINTFLDAGGRPNALRMSLGLLAAGVLRNQGREAESRAQLSDYRRSTREAWFGSVAEYLLGQQAEEALRMQAGEIPEMAISGFTAAGFWAEGAKDKKTALRFYRDALASFLDNWVEYDFVRERIKR
ncbi:MAG TPA: trypsin-like peptidase domain-containing protein, partial [Desulfobacterales bacterium]|nr:trypsin-like peptidase domain-containing protein [Desulfobacterales bacterium]